MQAWWQQLAKREQIFLMGGGIALAILLFYTLIWDPLITAVSSRKTAITEQRQLLQWMKQVVPVVQRAQQSDVPSEQIIVTRDILLNTVEQSLKENALRDFATSISQTNDNQIQINFDAVSFDHLTHWLTLIWQRFGIQVEQITIKPKQKSGEVSVDLSLELRYR